jgi:hypothetical protein
MADDAVRSPSPKHIRRARSQATRGSCTKSRAVRSRARRTPARSTARPPQARSVSLLFPLLVTDAGRRPIAHAIQARAQEPVLHPSRSRQILRPTRWPRFRPLDVPASAALG